MLFEASATGHSNLALRFLASSLLFLSSFGIVLDTFLFGVGCFGGQPHQAPIFYVVRQGFHNVGGSSKVFAENHPGSARRIPLYLRKGIACGTIDV